MVMNDECYKSVKESFKKKGVFTDANAWKGEEGIYVAVLVDEVEAHVLSNVSSVDDLAARSQQDHSAKKGSNEQEKRYIMVAG